jgi:IS5 family transposase
VLAAKALPGSPYDGHTLATVIPHVEGIIGNEIQRIIADKGYRGHGAPVFRQSRRLVSAVGGPRRARPPDGRGMCSVSTMLMWNCERNACRLVQSGC